MSTAAAGGPMSEATHASGVRPAYADNAVLTARELRVALRLSRSKWYDVAPSLPVSYALGKQSPRYVYGEVVKFLLRTGAAA